MRKWGWFVGLWVAGVLTLGVMAGLLKVLFRQML